MYKLYSCVIAHFMHESILKRSSQLRFCTWACGITTSTTPMHLRITKYIEYIDPIVTVVDQYQYYCQ